MKLYFLIIYSLTLCISFATEPLQTIQANQSVEFHWADGDSFPVDYLHPETHKKTTSVFRLYYVDCPETIASTVSDTARITEQQRYFALPNQRFVIKYGKEAKRRTRVLLSKPFTIHTAFANARGRSGKPRYYAMITLSDGRDLASALVEEGLARVIGVAREMPNGISAKDYKINLSDKELVAAIEKKGAWSVSDSQKLVSMRKEARKLKAEQKKQLNNFQDIPTINAENPLNINSASIAALKSIKGIGDATARKIILKRPFKSVQELYLIKGLHKSQIDKYIHLLHTPMPPGNK